MGCLATSATLAFVPWAYAAAEVLFVGVIFARWRSLNALPFAPSAQAPSATASAAQPGAATASRDSLQRAALAGSDAGATQTSDDDARRDVAASVASAPACSPEAAACAQAALTRFEAVAADLARGGAEAAAAFLRLWFHGAPVSDVRRGNLTDLLAYAFFYERSSAAVQARGLGPLLEAMADRMEGLLAGADPGPDGPELAAAWATNPSAADPPAAADPLSVAAAAAAPASAGPPSAFAAAAAALPEGEASADEEPGSPRRRRLAAAARVLAPGTNPAARFMAHSHEPLPHFYRPLVFYAGMEGLAWLNHCMLTAAGFSRVPWPRPPRGAPHDSVRADHYYYVANMRPDGRARLAGTVGRTGVAGADAGVGPEGAAAPQAPLVFLHGVGMGLQPYVRLLVALAATGAPIIAFELKHISQRWTAGPPPTMERLADDVADAVQRYYGDAAGGAVQPGTCGVLAHSFGTAVAAVLMRRHPGLVSHVTMLDPICFQMWAPRLLRNFIYRRLGATSAAAAAFASAAAAAAQPETAAATAAAVAAATATLDSRQRRRRSGGILASLSGLFEDAGRWALSAAGSVLGWFGGLVLDLLMLGPAREMHCTALLCRRVVWAEVNLWAERVPKNCTVVLSGRDDLMDTPAVAAWLRARTLAHVHVFPELHHAQICVAWGRQDAVLDEMLRNVYGKDEQGRPPPGADSRTDTRGSEGGAGNGGDIFAASSPLLTGQDAGDLEQGGWEAAAADGAGQGAQGRCRRVLVGGGTGCGGAEDGGLGSDAELAARHGGGGRARHVSDGGGGGDSCDGGGGGCRDDRGGAFGRARLRAAARRRASRRLGSGEAAPDSSVGSGEGAGEDGSGSLLLPLRPWSPVVRHDSAGSYLRLPSLGGLSAVGGSGGGGSGGSSAGGGRSSGEGEGSAGSMCE
ncbi:hypothetical protein HYH03_009698 [Edaphochlamys debaryana]|uniref:AB hydrolase-1 domain-containing protein n=1 Tax=Edaphochlamys debaryana TaxID=47281 RepID=A0A836BXF8_9CHLO|nr:hypothetical protein HYH03_009698 [Edaphochlamys debaryana]|eukprot:KAG2491967.1 hypothetical protein HYH03_009698 [Edaphochlamys debaryana]